MKKLFNEDKGSDLSEWSKLVYKLNNPEAQITI
jgi:hypothetical protein